MDQSISIRSISISRIQGSRLVIQGGDPLVIFSEALSLPRGPGFPMDPMVTCNHVPLHLPAIISDPSNLMWLEAAMNRVLGICECWRLMFNSSMINVSFPYISPNILNFHLFPKIHGAGSLLDPASHLILL